MKRAFRICLLLSSFLNVVAGVVLLAVGYIVIFRTEMLSGYLTPIVKIIPSGGGTETNVWAIYNITTISCIAFGAVVIFVGCVGCLAAIRHNTLLVSTHVIFTTMMIFSQLVIVGLINTMNIQSEDSKTELRNNLINHYGGPNATDLYTKAWDYAFVTFDCCAVEKVTDFLYAARWDRVELVNGNVTTVQIPVTCCKQSGSYQDLRAVENDACAVNATAANSNFQTSCFPKLCSYLIYYGLLMSYTSVGVVPFEVMPLVIIIRMYLDFRNRRKKTIPYRLDFAHESNSDVFKHSTVYIRNYHVTRKFKQ